MTVKIFSEWDMSYGHNWCFEGTIEEAIKETKETWDFMEFDKELRMTFEQACEQNLIQFKND